MSVKNLLEGAIRLEMQSRKDYEMAMSEVQNPIFMERLAFILAEEEWQEELLRSVYAERFGTPPEYQPEVVEVDANFKSLVEWLMERELEMREFYIRFFEGVDEKDVELRKLVYYFVKMELTHYQILEAELESIERFEDDEKYWSEIIEKEVE